MPTPAGYTQDERVNYDCALSWIDFNDAEQAVPFFWANNADTPYRRRTAELSTRQLSVSSAVGEQALDDFWRRSQGSFHWGEGIEWLDVVEDPNLIYRYDDSNGVEVTQPGRLGLVREVVLDEAASSNNNFCISYNNSGDGVLWSDDNALYTVDSSSTKTAVTWGGSSTIVGLASDGSRYYALDDAGVWRGNLPGGAGTKIWSLPASATAKAIGFAKQRLFVAFEDSSGVSWIATLATNPGTVPTTIVASSSSGAWATGQGRTWDHPTDGWEWVSIQDGPGVVYAAGYSGPHSAIYAMTLASDDTVGIPFVMVELPALETVWSMLSYMGTYLVVGTNAGVRVGTIQTDGSVSMGPLSIESGNRVRALAAYGQYVFAGGVRTSYLSSNRSTLTTTHGIYKLDLGTPVINKWGNNTGRYAYQKYLSPASGAGTQSLTARSIAMVGDTGRLAYTIYGEGLYVEAASNMADRGWLTTGKIRMDTLEPKIFQYLKVTNSVVDGRIEIQYQTDRDTTWVDLPDLTDAGYDTDATRSVDTAASDGKKSDWIRFRFILERGSSDATATPVITGYQLRSKPSQVHQVEVTLPLLCYRQERNIRGLGVPNRQTWDNITALEDAQRTNAVVRFQDYGKGEDRNVIITDVQFIEDHIPSNAFDAEHPSGLLLVTVRTTDDGA